MSGIEVLRRLRQRGAETPGMFLTVLGDQLLEEAPPLADHAVPTNGRVLGAFPYHVINLWRRSLRRRRR